MPGNHYGWKKKFDKFNVEDNQIAANVAVQTATATSGDAKVEDVTVIKFKGGPLETGPGDLYIGNATTTATATNTIDDQIAVAADVELEL